MSADGSPKCMIVYKLVAHVTLCTVPTSSTVAFKVSNLSNKACVTKAVHKHLCVLVLLVKVMQCWSAVRVESEQR